MLRRALLTILLVPTTLIVPAAPAQAALGLTATFSARQQRLVVPGQVRLWRGAASLSCRINGNRCDGSADRAPNVPSGLAVTGRTATTVSLAWTVTGLPAVVTGRSPQNEYSLTVRARDTYDKSAAASSTVTDQVPTSKDLISIGVWTYSKPQDRANNTLLMAEFRRQMDELTTTSGKRYLLTAFTPAETVKIAAGWHIGATEFSATWTSPRCRATTSTTLHNGL
jgi:hypothetical protein